ncbi:MAG: TlpA disulfide reductase family protein [Dehalococcoidales bacterium]|nr:TlpA disulfide reductase family protein [Dehalococcoidales bacterium]
MRRLSRLALLLAISLVALVLVLPACSSGKASAQEEGYSAGNLAPGFGLQNLAGETVSLNDFRGRPVLINFWASWCPPCRAEMPLIQQLYENKDVAGKGLAILAIDIGEKPDVVEQFIKGNGLTFPVLLDSQQIVAEKYNVGGIPTTFFIDKDGIIKDVRVGAFSSETQIIIGLRKILP